MAVLSWRVWVGIFYFGLFFYGLFIFLTDIEENKCEMTYMFENPEYIKQTLPEKLIKKFPKYNLYLYGEGRYAEQIERKAFDGVPVLFIPGSGGSYRQIRSIASIALRMAYSQRSPFHFNFFTIDYNQELSALHGGFLWEQTVFLKECILHILNLYQQKGLERSIILIGHSMGGVIARAVFLLPNFDSSLISFIITEAAPHKRAPLSLDSHMTNYYSEVNDFWNQSQKLTNFPPIISIGGGERDILIRSDLTMLEGYSSQPNLTVLTTSMPGVWVSTDHLCILWCKQLMMTVTRCLFDLIDKSTLSVTKDKASLNEVVNYYFRERSRGYHFVPNAHLVPVTFSQTGEWITKTEMSWRFSRNKIIQAVYILVPLKEGEIIIVHAVGIEKLNWIFACNVSATSKICTEGENLSNKGKVVPTFAVGKTENRFFQISAKELLVKGHSHLLVHLAPTAKINIYGERYKPQNRHKIANLPRLLHTLVTFSPLRILTSTLTEGAVYRNISLKGLSEVWQYYSFSIETRICKHGVTGDGFVRFHVPWSNEDRYYPIKSSLNSVTVVKGSLYEPQPLSFKSHPQLHIVLNPECSYVATVKIPIGHLSAQYIRSFNYIIPTYISALLLGTLSAQLHTLTKQGILLPILTARKQFPTFVLLVIVPELIAFFLKHFDFVTKFIPKPDDIALAEQRQYFVLLRPIGYLIAYGIVIALSLTSQAFLILAGKFIVWIRNGDKIPMLPSPKQSGPTSLLIFLLCCCLTLIALCLCGALAMVITLFIQLFRLISMCGYNRLEEDRRGATASSTRWHFHHCLCLLQLFATTITLPSLFVWALNVFDSPHLSNDPHLVPAVVSIMAHASLWQPGTPVKSNYRCRTIVCILSVLCVLVCMYALTTTWRLTHFVATAFAFVAAHQVACKARQNHKID